MHPHLLALSCSTRPGPGGREVDSGRRAPGGVPHRPVRLALAAACVAIGFACSSPPESTGGCPHACEVEWHGCYTSCDQRARACLATCDGGETCEARCRQAHPLWKDRCDELNRRCLEGCAARDR